MTHTHLLAAAGAALSLAQPAPPPSLLITGAELAAALKDPETVVLHVSDRASSFEAGHIPGARFLGYGDIAVDSNAGNAGNDGVGSELPRLGHLERVFEVAGVSDSSRVVIYGSSTVAAARAFFTLDVLGHRRVALLDGGLRAWRDENRPIETGPAPAAPRPGQFTPTLNARKIVDAQYVQANTRLDKPGAIALIDVRPDPEFLGTDGGMSGRHAAGHIRGARQLPWDTLTAPDGRFLPREQLEAKLRGAGASADKPVVPYCMVGMRASVVYFIARHLGYDARLYDGSIVDWSQRKLPVVTGRD